MEYIAYWGGYGHREPAGNSGFHYGWGKPSFIGGADNEFFGRFDRTRGFVPMYFEFVPYKDWYILSKTCHMSGGSRGFGQTSTFMVIPRVWVESEYCDITSLLDLFPQDTDYNYKSLGNPGASQLVLPRLAKRGHDSTTVKPADLIEMRKQLAQTSGSYFVLRHLNTIERAQVMCHHIDTAHSSERSDLSFITVKYENRRKDEARVRALGSGSTIKM